MFHSHDKCESSKDQQQNAATDVNSTSALERGQRGDVFCSNGSDSGMPSVMTSIVEMGALSPVQEESAAVVTTNPMRKALAHATPFHSLGGEEEGMAPGAQLSSNGGESAMREGEEEEETEGMFADAAVVAELAAAAAKQAQKPEQMLVANSGRTPPSWGWRQIPGGWMKSPLGHSPNSTTFANGDGSKGFAREPASKVNYDPLGAATAATVAASSRQAVIQHPPQIPSAAAPQELVKNVTDPPAPATSKAAAAAVTTLAATGVVAATTDQTPAARPQVAPVASKPVTVTEAPSGVVTANAQQTPSTTPQVAPLASKPAAVTATPSGVAAATVQQPPAARSQVAPAATQGAIVTTAASGTVAATAQQSPAATLQTVPVATKAMVQTAAGSGIVPAQQTPAGRPQVAPVATVEQNPVATTQANPAATDKKAPVSSGEPVATRRDDDKTLVSAEKAAVGNPAVLQVAKNPIFASIDSAKTEPELEIPYPSAHIAENGPTKVNLGKIPAGVVKGREKDVAATVAGNSATGVDAARQIPAVGERQANVSLGLHRTDSEKAVGVADVFPPASSAVQKASTLPVDRAVKTAVLSATTLPSPMNANDFPVQQSPLRVPSMIAATQPGTTQPADPTCPAPGGSKSVNTSTGTTGRLLAEGEVSPMSKQRPLPPLATTPDRTPQVAGAPSSSGLSAQWTTPLATPDRTPRESTTAPKPSATPSAAGSGTSWTTPLATPDRPRVTAAPDSEGGEATPERTAKSDSEGAPRAGMASKTPTDEAQFAWHLESPAGVDGLPPPSEKGTPVIAAKSRGREIPSILGVSSIDTAAECPTDPLASDPQSTNVLSHASNASGETAASYSAFSSTTSVAEGPGFAASPVAAFVAAAESAQHNRPSLDPPKSSASNPAPSPSGAGGYDIEDFDTSDGVQGKQAAGGTQDPFNEADKVAALVAEAMELADKDGTSYAEALYPAAGDVALAGRGQKADPAIETSTEAKAMPLSERLEEGRFGSGRSILHYTEGEAAEEGNAEKDAEEVKALIAEALALVKEAAEDAIEYPTEETGIIEGGSE